MAEDSSSSRQMKKTTKTYVMKTDSQGNVTTHTDVQVSGSGSSESGWLHLEHLSSFRHQFSRQLR